LPPALATRKVKESEFNHIEWKIPLVYFYDSKISVNLDHFEVNDDQSWMLSTLHIWCHQQKELKWSEAPETENC